MSEWRRELEQDQRVIDTAVDYFRQQHGAGPAHGSDDGRQYSG